MYCAIHICCTLLTHLCLEGDVFLEGLGLAPLLLHLLLQEVHLLFLLLSVRQLTADLSQQTTA